jgi:hypothetical protein
MQKYQNVNSLDYQILNFFYFDYPNSSIFGFDQVFAQENNLFGVAYNVDMVICMCQSSVEGQACKSS